MQFYLKLFTMYIFNVINFITVSQGFFFPRDPRTKKKKKKLVQKKVPNRSKDEGKKKKSPFHTTTRADLS